MFSSTHIPARSLGPLAFDQPNIPSLCPLPDSPRPRMRVFTLCTRVTCFNLSAVGGVRLLGWGKRDAAILANVCPPRLRPLRLSTRTGLPPVGSCCSLSPLSPPECGCGCRRADWGRGKSPSAYGLIATVVWSVGWHVAPPTIYGSTCASSAEVFQGGRAGRSPCQCIVCLSVARRSRSVPRSAFDDPSTLCCRVRHPCAYNSAARHVWHSC